MVLRAIYRDPASNYLWSRALSPYIKNTGVYKCPGSSNHRYTEVSNADRGYMSIGYNWAFADVDVALSQFEHPTEIVLFGDTYNGDASAGYRGYEFAMTATRMCDTYEALSARHGDGANLGFADGHVKWVRNTINAKTGLRFYAPAIRGWGSRSRSGCPFAAFRRRRASRRGRRGWRNDRAGAWHTPQGPAPDGSGG